MMIFIKEMLMLISAMLAMYAEIYRPWNWKDIFVPKFEESEEYFVELGDFYSRLDYQNILPSTIKDDTIIEINGIKYGISLDDDTIKVIEKRKDEFDDIGNDISEKMGFYNGLRIYLNKDTKSPYRITINISSTFPRWMEPFKVPCYLIWVPQEVENFCEDSFYCAIKLNENWYFVYRAVI